MREGIDDKAFPEQGAKVSIHSDGSFESLGCVLTNTNLNVLTAVFYWFTLRRDEPFLQRFKRLGKAWNTSEPAIPMSFLHANLALFLIFIFFLIIRSASYYSACYPYFLFVFLPNNAHLLI